MNDQTTPTGSQLETTHTWRIWLSLALLVIAAIFSFIDRQILSLMVTPIKADLGVNDVQIGLLQGFAFAVFYSLAALPLGWLADRSNRKNIVAIGIALWSVMTAFCGLAQNFAQLFLARMAVGVGEATLSASGHSLIADMFEEERLPLAMSIYATGVALGAGIAFIGGGFLVEMFSQMGGITVAGVALKGWQAAFIAVGLPGLLVAGLMSLFMKEPERRAVASHNGDAAHGFWAFVSDRSDLAWRFMLGVGLLTAAGFANLAWMPSFFERSFGWNTAEAGAAIGTMLLLVTLPGGVVCGYLAQRWVQSGRIDGAMRLMSYVALIGAPLLCTAFLMPKASFAIILMLIPMAISSAYVGLAPASIQAVTPGQFRGRVAAFQMLITNLIGMVSGPLIVGLLTQYAFQDPARIGWSLAVTAPVLSVAGALLLLSALPAYRVAHGKVLSSDSH